MEPNATQTNGVPPQTTPAKEAPVLPLIVTQAQPAAAPAAPQNSPSQPAGVSMPTETFNARIAQAQAAGELAVAKQLGFESVDAMKASVAAGKAAIEANKTEAQRQADELAALRAASTSAAALAKDVATYADAELARLTPEQVAAVKAIAGDDKGRTLSTIATLRPTWGAGVLSQTQTSGSPGTTVQTHPIAQPASTTTNGAPPPAGAAGVVDHKATYESMQQTNPFEASRYLLQHHEAIQKK
jgi:hypothetical protein